VPRGRLRDATGGAMDGRLALSRRRQDGRVGGGALPLTERLLGRLPGPRAAWLLAWAAVPLAAGLLPASFLATVGAEPIAARLLIGLVYAYAVALAGWAVGRFAGESDTVQRSLDRLAPHPGAAATPVLRGMASTLGLLALTLAFVALTVWRTALLGDPLAAVLWLPVTLLVNLPLMTAVWVYFALLLGLDRLGRRSLSLTAFPEDLSLASARSDGWRSPRSGSTRPGLRRCWWSTSPTRPACC
jgi:hypothetical protein